MMKKIVLFSLICFVILCTGTVNASNESGVLQSGHTAIKVNQPSKSVPDKMENYHLFMNKVCGYSVLIPKEFNLTITKKPDSIIFGETDQVNANIKIDLTPLPKSEFVRNHLPTAIEYKIKELYPHASVKETGKTTVLGYPVSYVSIMGQSLINNAMIIDDIYTVDTTNKICWIHFIRPASVTKNSYNEIDIVAFLIASLKHC